MSSRRQHVGVATAAVLTVGLLAGCGTRTELTSAEPESTAPVTVFVFSDEDHAPLDVAQLVAHRTATAEQAPTAQETVDRAAQVRRAVTALLEHAPADGEASLWNGMCAPAPGVAGVDVAGDEVVVRLERYGPRDTGHAICDLSVEGWLLQRQQLAWTVAAVVGPEVVVRAVTGDDRFDTIEPTRPDRAFLSPDLADRVDDVVPGASTAPVFVTALQDTHLAASPLGDVLIGELRAGTQGAATCFVASATTNAGVEGSAVEVTLAGGEDGFVPARLGDAESEESWPPHFLAASDALLRHTLHAC